MKAREFVAEVHRLRDQHLYATRPHLMRETPSVFHGTFIYPLKSDFEDSSNEIENVIRNYDLRETNWLLRGIFFEKHSYLLKDYDEELYVFATFNGVLCYDPAQSITWRDYDEMDEQSRVADSPEKFLDMMFAYTSQRLLGGLTDEELVEQCIQLSGSTSSRDFLEAWIGV
jgi:hypothetical protein